MRTMVAIDQQNIWKSTKFRKEGMEEGERSSCRRNFIVCMLKRDKKRVQKN